MLMMTMSEMKELKFLTNKEEVQYVNNNHIRGKYEYNNNFEIVKIDHKDTRYHANDALAVIDDFTILCSITFCET